MKTCTLCLRELPLDEFYFHSRDGRYYSRCRECVAGADRRRRQRKSKGETIWLDVRPFVDWLLRVQAEAERRAREAWTPHPKAHAMVELTHRTGLSERRIRSYVNGEHRHIHIDTVDRALLRDGSSSLRDLYPALFEFSDQEVA